jgi:hypothetical protein
MKGGVPIAILLSLILSGCAIGLPSQVGKGLQRCDAPDAESCIVSDNSGQGIQTKPPASEPAPLVGLALSGGGSKSAPFVMGVLKRFVDNDWIYDTDYLASVSGGSYSAMYMYYRAYRAMFDLQPPLEGYPGISRYFVDVRTISEKVIRGGEHIDIQWKTRDAAVGREGQNLAASKGGCETAGPYPPAEVGQSAYQGWVECYQDLLRTGRSPLTIWPHGAKDKVDYYGQLGVTFSQLFIESIVTAPLSWVANGVFDWKLRLSPTQARYLRGILRTYAFFPDANDGVPISPLTDRFGDLLKNFSFEDFAKIYTLDPASANALIGGYLPMWIIVSTATPGNLNTKARNRHYDLNTDVFETTVSGFGSGRYGYVRGSPALVGLTVPLAVLSSAAFFDSAQHQFGGPRALATVALETLNLRWGLDIANYLEPDSRRRLHSVLIFPFYYLDPPEEQNSGPTIHLSDGGQSGDNLGLVPLLRRHVKHIVAVAGDQDYDGKHDVMYLDSLCAVNYYLNTNGWTINFDGAPGDSGPPVKDSYHLARHCKWKGNRRIFIDATQAGSEGTSAFQWRQRVWVGRVRPYTPDPPTDPGLLPKDDLVEPERRLQGLEETTIYYINAALDKDAWLAATHDFYPPGQKGDEPVEQENRVIPCNGVYWKDGLSYGCFLIRYIHDTEIAVDGDPKRWKFPQTPTAFTTYSNSIQLFRSYRELGWLYAGELCRYPDLLQALRANRIRKHLGTSGDGKSE